MELAMIGLGRMGTNMARRLLRGGHRVIAYNRSPAPTRELEKEGAVGTYTLEEVAHKLAAPRILWTMLPAGDPVTQTIQALLSHLSRGDILIDGGNSFYKDSMRRAEQLKERGVHFLDVGVSGGIWGLEQGFNLMIGGDGAAFERVEPLLMALAPEDGYAHVGPSGAGHFVKMIHNGIEYGLLQAYAEGFELLEMAQFDLDLHRIARLWNRGSVVRSWLLELLEGALAKDPQLDSIKGYVEDSGEGRWTLQEAIDLAVPMPVIAASLFARFRSRQEDSFAAKVIAALRREFGGHAVQTE